MTDTNLAFPGAEGFGAHAQGGRGGAVVTVTSLADSGEGSLRWALEQVHGPRTVVFAVNGEIKLQSQIMIRDGAVTIAGQTAEGDGITISGARIRVKADDVIIRDMKFRPGDAAEGMDPDDRDGLMIGTTDFEINDVIVDRSSFTWATDENLTIQGKINGLTVSNSIIAEGLSHSLNSAGEHSKGLLISNWSGSDGGADSHISIIKNLFASNMNRNPEVRAGQAIEIVNNLIYNYGTNRAISLGEGSGGTLETEVAVIGNVFDAGPDTVPGRPPISLQMMGAGSRIYLSDNLIRGQPTDASGNQSVGSTVIDRGGGQYLVATPSFAGSAMTVLDSIDVRDYVLANAGAGVGGLDRIDQRIVDYVVDGGGFIPDSPRDVGGQLETAPVPQAIDSDRDGMANWFEDLHGFDAARFDANGDSDADGYTNLEEYLNGLVTGFELAQQKPLLGLALDDGSGEIVALGQPSFAVPAVVHGFDVGGGDRIDFTDLLAGYVEGEDDINDFLRLSEVHDSSILTADLDGAGTAQIAHLVAIFEDTPLTLGELLAAQADGASAGELVGTAGADDLVGTAADEALWGGAGDDRLAGAGGFDELWGGAGEDTFVFRRADSPIDSMDVIRDFQSGLDRVDLDIVPSSMATAWVGADGFAPSVTAAQALMARGFDAVFVASAGESRLFWNSDPDAYVPDQAIYFDGVGAPTEAALSTIFQVGDLF